MVLDRTRRFISDVVKEGKKPRFDDQELCDSWTDAQDDLVLYVARPKTFTIAASLSRASLPDDLYRIECVKSDRNYTMLQLDAFEDGDVDLWEGCYWHMTHDTIEFTTILREAAAQRLRSLKAQSCTGRQNSAAS